MMGPDDDASFSMLEFERHEQGNVTRGPGQATCFPRGFRSGRGAIVGG